jgi:hypothetical protein
VGRHHLVQLESNYAEGQSDLDTQLYLCVGEAEEAQAPEARMVSAFEDFAQRLEGRAYPSLRMRHEVLPARRT